MAKGSGKSIPRVEIQLNPSPEQSTQLLEALRQRFEDNMPRHKNLKWAAIQEKLQTNPDKLSSLFAMESSGGEPDVIGSEGYV